MSRNKQKILYSVVFDVETSVHENWLDWIQNYFIPKTLKTGCFDHCRACRLIEDDEAGFKTYRLDYICHGIEAYEHYNAEFAPAMERELKRKFIGKFSYMKMLYYLVSEEKNK